MGERTGGARRVFLGFDGPLLPRAADWLVAEYGSELGEKVVALPGARAGRRLRELLTRRAPPDWTPPRILTHGHLTDELIELERPSASRLVRTLAWERALRGLTASRIAEVTAAAPDPEDTVGWTRLAETIRSLHAELAPEGITFEDLAATARGSGREREAERFAVLYEAQAAQASLLARAGLSDPHAGRFAAIEAGRLAPEGDVVLVGTSDVNRLLRRLLEHLEARVTALVFAPEELASGFDRFGFLETEFWRDRDVPLPLARWHVVEKPADQAERVVSILSGLGGRYASGEVTFGTADSEVTPYLERQLESLGLTARHAAGLPLSRTKPVRLLAAARDFLGGRAFADFAALVRHPDLERALRGLLADEDEPIAAIDAYFAEHLPDRLPASPLAGRSGKRFGPVAEASLELLEGLRSTKTRRRLAEWAEPVRRFLVRIYGERELDEEVEADRVLAEALRHLADTLAEFSELPPETDGEVSASEALGRVLWHVRGDAVPPGRLGPDSVELMGWLELFLDDAPVLILTGFNDGRVPASFRGDPFLPDGMRRGLGLPTSETRTARDVYALTVLNHSREELFAVSGRKSAVGDPIAPSRLAFFVPAKEAVERVERFLEGRPGDGRSAGRPGEVETGGLPRLSEAPPVESISVSAFRTYLESPYTYYLKYVLKLETVEDELQELSPRDFGNLAHDVLADFGQGDLRDSEDEEAIREFLVERIEKRAGGRYSSRPLPAVALQIEQMKYRLSQFAARQAERARDGWRIVQTEWKPEGGGVPLDVDGQPMAVRGRIDRIDHHPASGRWAILDYKTGGTDPDRAHRRGDGTWRDLQLPLYTHLCVSLGYEGTPELGYFIVGGEPEKIGVIISKLGDAEVAEGLEVARQVVRDVRSGEFFEVGRRPPYEEVFRAAAGIGLIGAEVEE